MTRLSFPKYADRFFYGTDIVVTDYEGKDEAWLVDLFQTYRDLLEQETFTTFLSEETFNGLYLDYETLTQIYEDNWNALLEPVVVHEEESEEVEE